MKTTKTDITFRVVFETEDDVDVNDVVADMPYSFDVSNNIEGDVKIVKEEMTIFHIVE